MAWIAGLHEVFADQKGAITCVHQPAYVERGVDTALADSHNVRRYALSKFKRCVQLYFKRTKIAVVNADNSRAGINSQPQFRVIVDLDQRGHVILSGQLAEFAHLAHIENGRNKKNRVGATSSCLDDLKTINRKVFT